MRGRKLYKAVLDMFIPDKNSIPWGKVEVTLLIPFSLFL
jgi:hypothetical protein